MNSRKKRKFNTKKGISLVVAIALAAVLFLTTTSFVSLALLQQKETSMELNTRQAYVSAKSALDIAKEMLENGQIKLTDDGTFYYVLHYDGSEIKATKFSSDDLAISFIESNKDKIVGNSYIKINKNGKDCTVSAFSSENKYSANPDDASQGDLSMKFEATEKVPPDGEETKLRINKGSVNSDTPPPPSSVNRFLLVGAQTNFSLLMGAHKSLYHQFNKDYGFKTLQQSHLHGDHGSFDNSVVFIPSLNTNDNPITTQFPLIYTNAVKINSEAPRCTYKVYDEGVYFLGKYSGRDLTGTRYPSSVSDVSFFTSNSCYGIDLHCKFIVISNDMVALDPSDKVLTAHYYGQSGKSDDNTYTDSSDTSGVVVYIPKSITIQTFDNNSNLIENKNFSYTPGYYWLPNGVDLFSIKMSSISTSHSNFAAMNNKNLYTFLTDSSHNVKNLHSAFENVSVDKYKVNILDSGGVFSTGGSGTYSATGARTSKPHSGWDNYSIYCGPSVMPALTATGYYDMFCGDTFNYLWYNPFAMNVEHNVRMSIRSKNTVLTIGGDPNYVESAYKLEKSIGAYYKGDTLPTHYQEGPVKASRLIEGKGNAEFWIRPYWNESSFTLTVMNDFFVTYPGCNETGGYLIKAGVYENIYTNTQFSKGINLFSSDAETYFKNTTGDPLPVTPSDDATVGWVTGGKITNLSEDAPELTQTGKYITFKAGEGNLATSAEYSAEAIDCVFSHTVETNNATLKAKLLSIDASAIKGTTLNINTKEGSGDSFNKSNCLVTNDIGTTTKYNSGHLLHLKKDMELYNDTDPEPWMKLKKGYYYFVTPNDRVNILDKGTWTNEGPAITIYYADSIGVDVIGYEMGNAELITHVKFDQGGYY